MAYLAPNGDYTGNGNRLTGEKEHDVTYKIVSTSPIDIGTAWGEAWSLMNAQHPFFRGCILRTVKVTGQQDTAGCVYTVVGHYVKERDEQENPRWASLHFSTRGGREKRVHSYATKSYLASGEEAPAPATNNTAENANTGQTRAAQEGGEGNNAGDNANATPATDPTSNIAAGTPDFKHGIGFNNGVFQGVDIVVPQMGFSIEASLPASDFGEVQLAYMHNITGSVNVQPMWIFPKGSVLFLGVTGNSQRIKNPNTGVWELWFHVSFEFEAKPPIVNGTIQPFTGITKEGLQYFWVFHADRKDENSQTTIPRPIAAYVETVYPYADFSWFNVLRW